MVSATATKSELGLLAGYRTSAWGAAALTLIGLLLSLALGLLVSWGPSSPLGLLCALIALVSLAAFRSGVRNQDWVLLTAGVFFFFAFAVRPVYALSHADKVHTA